MLESLKITRLDYFTMKSQFAMYGSLLIILVMFGVMGSSVAVLSITAAWFVALLSSNIFVIEEKNSLNRLYGTLPVKKADIVLGRYLFVFLNYAASFFAAIILYSVISLIQNKTIELTNYLFGFSSSILVFSTIIGIQMPLFFNMGYTKAKVWSMIPFVVVIGLVVIPSFVSALASLIDFMQSNQSTLMAAGILASFCIQLLSYKIAVVVYNKRR